MRNLVVFVSLFLFVGFSAFAQKSKPASSLQNIQDKDQERGAQDSLNLRIVNVLYRTADEAKNWNEVKVSSQIQAQIADLLWDFDAISAENYLIRAWDKAKQAKESEEKPSRFRNYSTRVEVSREVLMVARKRQPELAKRWLKELSDLAEEDFSKRNKGLFDDRTARSAVLLQMAMQAAESDPQAAASLATESLLDGISFGFQSVLIKIQEKNPELAAQVFRSALKRINSVGIASASEIQILYSYLYTPGQINSTADATTQNNTVIAVGRNQPRITSAAQLYPSLAQEFVQTAARAIMQMSFPPVENVEKAAREQYGIIGVLLSRLGNASPELAQALQARMAAITGSANFSPPTQNSPDDVSPIKQGENQSDYQKRLLDEILEDSEKMPDSLQKNIFIAQGVLRSGAEQFEKAENVAEHIDDKELREQIINFLIYRTSLDLIKNDKFDDAGKSVLKNSEPRQRAVILIVGGQKLADRKDFFQARGWLSDAEKLFEKNKSSDEDWINIGFGLVSAYAQFENSEAAQILNQSGKLIEEDSKYYNRDKAPLAIGFSGLDFSDFTYDSKNFSLDSAIKSFPKENFEDVLSALGEIKNPQAKGQGILILSRKYLKKTNLAQK